MRVRNDSTLDRLSPEELAVRSQRGSTQAFAALVERFELRLFNFLLRRVGSRSDAEDLVQESFMRAWERIDRYQPRWKFSTWLYTIATRLAISHRRKIRQVSSLTADDGAAPQLPPELEDCSKIWTLVDSVLSEDQRTAIWLRYVEDMSIEEIATVLRKSDVAVRVMLFRSRAVLAKHMSAPSQASPDVTAVRIVPKLRPQLTGGVR